MDHILSYPVEPVEELPDGELLETMLAKETSYSAGASFSVAQVLGPYVGVQAGVEFRMGGTKYVATFEEGETKIKTRQEVLSTGIAFTANGAPRFPMGLLVEYRFRGLFEQTEDLEVADLNTSRHRIGFGLQVQL